VDGKHNLAEIWSQVSGGGCKANIESMSRLASLCFRSNVDPKHILDQLSSAFCKTSMDNTGSKSCGQVIAKEIRKFLDSGKTIIEIEKNKVDSIMKLIENFNCDTKISQEEAKAIKDLGITKIEVAPTQEVDNPNICYDGKPHQFDGQGCQSCVKCGFNKCGE
jgi:DNA-directed RNA polymerase subunit N (RpoN/RPB10)